MNSVVVPCCSSSPCLDVTVVIFSELLGEAISLTTVGSVDREIVPVVQTRSLVL